MEYRPRIADYGVPETDPATDREYYVANDRNGRPNAVMSVRRRIPMGDISNKMANDYKPTINKPKVRIYITKYRNNFIV